MKKTLLVLIGLLITSSYLVSQVTVRVPQQYPTVTGALNYVTGADTTITYTILVESGNTIIYEPTDVIIPPNVILDLKNARISFPGNLTTWGWLRSENSYIYLNDGIIIAFGYVDCYRTRFIGNTIFVNSIHLNYNHTNNNYNRHFAECTITTKQGMQVYQGSFSTTMQKSIQGLIGINAMDNAIVNVLGSIFEDNTLQDILIGSTAATKVTHSSFRGLPPTIQIWNNSPNIIDATYNHWENGIRIINTNIYGSIDTANAVGPNAYPWFFNKGDNRVTEIESGLFLKKTVAKNDKPVEKIPGIEELGRAIRLFFDEKYDETLAEMYKLVDNYKDGVVGKRALVFIEAILAATDRDVEILPMLEQYSNGNSKVAEFAYYKKGHHYIRQGECDRAIALIKAIEFSEEDTDLRQSRLYDLGLIHYVLDKKAEAFDYFTELVTTYPDCQLAEVTNTFYLTEKNGYKKPSIANNKIVTETKLFANYPNPFNPSTVIKYQLSDASQVSLKVYDVMGREIANLVNSYQNKGSYDVTFNANNFSSGIYFYKLNANGKQLINKMLLMK